MSLPSFAAALEYGGYSLAAVEPRVVSTRTTGSTARVVVRAKDYADKRTFFEFELTRRGGRWRITHDDMTETAVRRHAEIVQQSVIGPSEAIGPVAKKRARRVVRTYRLAGRDRGRG